MRLIKSRYQTVEARVFHTVSDHIFAANGVEDLMGEMSSDTPWDGMVRYISSPGPYSLSVNLGYSYL